MKLIADLHTHTTLSGHAFSSIRENIDGAKARQMLMVANTDHGPAMPGASSAPYLFLNQFIMEEEIDGVRLIKGAEVNILDDHGSFDIPDRILQKLELVLGSLHEVTIDVADQETNQRRIEAAMATQMIDVIAHPGNPAFPLDYDRLASQAKAHDMALELNNTSLRGLVRKGSRPNIIEMLEACRRHQVLVSVGSDAHWMNDVGRLDLAIDLMEEINFPQALVVNADKERLLDFMGRRQAIRAKRSVRDDKYGG